MRLAAVADPMSGPPWRRAAGAGVALATVLLIDLTLAARHWPLTVIGLLDELAHVLTAWLLLAAVVPRRHERLVPWALGGALLIDVDHVPLYLWEVGAAPGAGRPVTHSLAFVVVLLALSLPSRRLRVPLGGLALGVLLHLVRDLATGPGVTLFWPATDTNLLVPYSWYVVALCCATTVAVLRAVRRPPAAQPARVV